MKSWSSLLLVSCSINNGEPTGAPQVAAMGAANGMPNGVSKGAPNRHGKSPNLAAPGYGAPPGAPSGSQAGARPVLWPVLGPALCCPQLLSAAHSPRSYASLGALALSGAFQPYLAKVLYHTLQRLSAL